jgi:uncharacterized membrane protein
MKRERIALLDALRGFSVILMVIHHMLYNLVYVLDAPRWLFRNPAFTILHPMFAGLFILLSGISSRFSRGNIKRGLKVSALAVGITVVTYLINIPIWFGILHLLGFSMLFFGLTRKFWDILPWKFAWVIYIALVIVGAWAVANIPLQSEYLWMFGWVNPEFFSYDYFPILPWVFVFLLGTWAGVYIDAGALPERFYTIDPPVFPAIGRRSLLIYVLHQPILYSIALGIAFLRN